MLDLTAVLIVGIIFGTIYGLFFLFIRRKERITLMERGYDPSVFYSKPQRDRSLKYGMLLIAVGFGILLGNILTVTSNLEGGTAYFSMIFMLGGIALTVNYFIEKKDKEEERNSIE